MRVFAASVLLLCLWTAPAAADLYRWVDPETGSVKFSSYPPPWYGDAAKERRAPKVELIPARKASPPQAAAPDKAPPLASPAQAGKVPEELESRRKAMLQQMPVLAAQPGKDRGQAFNKHEQAFEELSDQIDKLDPPGAAARRSEAQALMEKIVKGVPR